MCQETFSSPEGTRRRPIPPHLVLRENISLDTIGNAYFLRVIHTDVMLDIRRLHVVTSAFHMPRTRAIFEFMFAIPTAHSAPYVLSFEDASDDGVYDDASILARNIRERQSLIGFCKTLGDRFGVTLTGSPPQPIDPSCVSWKDITPPVDVASWNVSSCVVAAAQRESSSLEKQQHRVTLAHVHKWLFTDHSAYATGLSMIRSDVVDAATLATY
mmetsp:Transcript_56571/g.64836  ORF Transcript_56571/g.64836 Transcript_56571/m.64836 type:complete len:214 (-) Transcript_56571:7-648(-)